MCFARRLPLSVMLLFVVAAQAEETHWAYQPVKCVELPADLGGWSEHPIDRFVSASWREQGLPHADLETTGSATEAWSRLLKWPA